MKKSEEQFLHVLEKLGIEQARIEESSPLPESVRPLAALLGEHPLPMLLLSSFVVAALISVWWYPWLLSLFEKGVLQWLLR